MSKKKSDIFGNPEHVALEPAFSWTCLTCSHINYECCEEDIIDSDDENLPEQMREMVLKAQAEGKQVSMKLMKAPSMVSCEGCGQIYKSMVRNLSG